MLFVVDHEVDVRAEEHLSVESWKCSTLGGLKGFNHVGSWKDLCYDIQKFYIIFNIYNTLKIEI